ncbi:hypothetical protein M8J77_024939 [Diaphorina citri]|nr:hypothetical protein M8J77_024939 [Diaphorina citri]
MSNPKRVSLTTIESNTEKIKTKRKGSFRINIPIVEEPASKEYSRFNYETLYKSALDKKRLKKDTNGAQNGLTNGGGLDLDDEGEDDDLAKLAKKFEQKYGGTQKKDNYSQLGAGYDEEDSFIDNTDAYNDELSEDLLPKHGGYYLNRGNLELERIDIPEEVIGKIGKRTVNVIQSSDEEEDGESSEAEESGRDENEEDEDEDSEGSDETENDQDEIKTEANGVVRERPAVANAKNERKPSSAANVKTPSQTDHSILSTIESVVGHSTKTEKKKKKRKREREETEGEGEHPGSKHRRQEEERDEEEKKKKKMSTEDSVSSSKHHKHAKKHKDKHEERKDKVHDHGKDKVRKSTGTTVKELLNEKKMDVTSTPPTPAVPIAQHVPVWTSPSSNLNDVIESVVRAAHHEPHTVRTPNSCEFNRPIIFSEDSASLPTSEDVDMSEDVLPIHTSASESVLINGHQEGSAPTTPNMTPNLPPTDLKIPETLPDSIRDLITALRLVANQVSNLSSRKTFPQDVNDLLIELEARCRTISSANKNAVYAHIGTFLPLSKDTLIKRARKMSVDKEEEKLEGIIKKLKLKIDAVMPGILLQYSKDCEVAANKTAAEKSMENASGDTKPATKQMLPRRIFPWDEQLRCYLREIVEIKARCFRIMNCRKDTEEDYIKEYLDTRIKPLWPDGWMKVPVLLREGRSQPNVRGKKYTPKPASKKIVQHTPQTTQTPMPKPEPHQHSKHQPPPKHKASEHMLLSAQAQTLLSSLAAVNSLSYQKSSSESVATSTPSLFSQIQSSLSKVPASQSSATNTEPSPPTSASVSNVTPTTTNSNVKKVPPPQPKPSSSPSPHTISNLINTTKAHVSSSKYNYPPEVLTTPPVSSNSFSVKPPGDLLPASTSLSSLLLHTSAQSYLPSLAYGLSSLSSSTGKPVLSLSQPLSKSCSTSTSPVYKLPPFSQPMTFPSPSSSPTLSRKSASPHSSSSPPKKRMSTPSPTLGEPSNILDLSPKGPPASISYSSKDRSVSPLSSKPINRDPPPTPSQPPTPLHREQATSPVTTKGGGGAMLSLKQRILQDNAKVTAPSPSPSSHPPYHQSDPKPSPLRESPSLAEVSVSAASALSQMIHDSLLSTPSGGHKVESNRTHDSGGSHRAHESNRISNESPSGGSHRVSDILKTGYSAGAGGVIATSGPTSAVPKPTAVHPTTPNPESRPEGTKSGGSVLDSQPRERKSSRSSSKDSDGKESEIVADVLKSLMSLNQMSESSAGSPDKSKVIGGLHVGPTPHCSKKITVANRQRPASEQHGLSRNRPRNISTDQAPRIRIKQLRFGTWNVRTLATPGASDILSEELKCYNMDIVALQEVRWPQSGKETTRHYQIYYSGNKDGFYQKGVAFAVQKHLDSAVMSFDAVNERICTIRIRGKFKNISAICIYAPTEDADEEDKDEFYEKLEEIWNLLPAYDVKLILGDANAQVGKEVIWRNTAGKESLHETSNDNGTRLLSLAVAGDMYVMSTMFARKNIHKETWYHPNGQTKNQIDHVLIDKRHRWNITNVRSIRGAECGSDHNLVLVKIYQRIAVEKKDRTNQTPYTDWEKLKDPIKASVYRMKISDKLNELRGVELEF